MGLARPPHRPRVTYVACANQLQRPGTATRHAGTVVACGEGAGAWREGDAVTALDQPLATVLAGCLGGQMRVEESASGLDDERGWTLVFPVEADR